MKAMAVKLVAGVILLAVGLYAMMGAAAGLVLLGVALILWAVLDARFVRQ